MNLNYNDMEKNEKSNKGAKTLERIKVDLDGQASGYVYQYSDETDSAYLAAIEVRPRFRRKGVGTKLIARLESFAKALGATNVSLWVEKDTWVYAWYKRNGYSYLEDHNDPNYVWMSKQI